MHAVLMDTEGAEVARDRLAESRSLEEEIAALGPLSARPGWSGLTAEANCFFLAGATSPPLMRQIAERVALGRERDVDAHDGRRLIWLLICV